MTPSELLQITKHFSTMTTNTPFTSSSALITRQLQRAAGLGLDSPAIQASAVSPQLNTITIPARIFYQPYVIGYGAGTLIVNVQAAVANPPPLPDQWRFTTAHAYQQFSPVDLPDILFRSEPYRDLYNNFQNQNTDIPVPMMHDTATGQVIRNSRGVALRYFSFLPRFISNDVLGMLLEFWFRLDPRLEMNDVRSRMEKNGANSIPKNNTLNMRRVRFRLMFGAESWGKCRSWPVRTELALLDRMSSQQICFNTMMKVDSQGRRLLKPSFAADSPDCAVPIGYFDAGLPLDYFLSNLSDTVPSRKMMARIILRKRLQTLATLLQPGPGSLSPAAYTRLNRADLPSWWGDNRSGNAAAPNRNGRAIHELDGLTHRQYLEFECGNPRLFAGIAARNRVRAA